MGEIILIKPASSDFKEQNRLLGNLDIPVSEAGQQILSKMIPEIRDMKLDKLYASPSDPCKTTSQTISEELDIPIKEKSSLENMDLGLWQGLQVDEIRRKQPKVFKQWLENPETICPPEGESVQDAVKRIKKTVTKIKKRKDRCGIIVSEPLASIIRFIIQKTDLTFQPLAQNDHEMTLEIIYPIQENKTENQSGQEVNPELIKKEGEVI